MKIHKIRYQGIIGFWVETRRSVVAFELRARRKWRGWPKAEWELELERDSE